MRNMKGRGHCVMAVRLTWTAMYSPGTLKDSNMISAVYSRFSGVLSGGSVWTNTHTCELSKAAQTVGRMSEVNRKVSITKRK